MDGRLADAVNGTAVLDALAVAEEVKQAAAAEAARALIAAVERANAQVEEVRTAQMESGEDYRKERTRS